MSNLDALKESYFANRDPAFRDESDFMEKDRLDLVCDLYDAIDNASQLAFNLLEDMENPNIRRAYAKLNDAISYVEEER